MCFVNRTILFLSRRVLTAFFTSISRLCTASVLTTSNPPPHQRIDDPEDSHQKNKCCARFELVTQTTFGDCAPVEWFGGASGSTHVFDEKCESDEPHCGHTKVNREVLQVMRP